MTAARGVPPSARRPEGNSLHKRSRRLIRTIYPASNFSSCSSTLASVRRRVCAYAGSTRSKSRQCLAPPRRILPGVATDRIAYGSPSARRRRRGIAHRRPSRHPVCGSCPSWQRKRHNPMPAIEPRLAAFAFAGREGFRPSPKGAVLS